MKNIGILFDLDGTLLNTLEDILGATNATLRHFGCPERTLAELRTFVGNGAKRQMALCLPGREDDPPMEEVLPWYKEYYRTHARVKTSLYPGIMDALRELKAQGYPMAVVSNKPDAVVQLLCRDFFGDLFDAVTGEVEGCARKPAPDLAYLVAERIGIPGENCIYVGDSEVDILTARNAGMVCLSVSWGFRDEDMLLEYGADNLCARTEELCSKVRELESIIHGK